MSSWGDVTRTVNALMFAIVSNQQLLHKHPRPLTQQSSLHWNPSQLQPQPCLIYFRREERIIFIRMKCCEEADQEEIPRYKFKEKQETQPLKFRLLSFLGLKEYLIDKYVFSRPQPRYQISNENGSLKIKTDIQISIHSQFEQEIRYIEDENHSVYAVSLNLRNRSSYAGTVIYSHGNSSDLSHSLSFISKFASAFPKFDYIVYDYTGYGKSSKQNITQDSVCQDLQLLIRNIVAVPEQIILWGFSLGTFPTAKMASKAKFKGVILQSPLASIYSLFADNLTPYSTFKNDCFSILQSVGSISSFLVIIHSRDDEVIPFKHAQVLYERHRMVSSNPYCFILEVTALKHNHMHAFLADTSRNKVRDQFHSYLNLIIDHEKLPKGRQLQLQKEIYLNDIGKYEQIELINVENRSIKEEIEHQSPVGQSINFTAVKKQVEFQIDDVTLEETIETNFMGGISSKTYSYFEVSRQAIDESETSQILPQRSAEKLHQ